ncbi:MAG TPA: MMPL family transporter [Methanocorpusculum sp.]|nr:MMPL family transporter [Methanocorpusculum sp.]
MIDISGQILQKRKLVIIITLLIAVLCLILIPQVSVNYNIIDYLPDEAPSTIALDVMNEEFTQGVPNARIMVPDVTIPEALELKQQFSAVDGVEEVTWLDDAVSLDVPFETLDTDTVEAYYKNNTALFSITLDDDKATEAVNELAEIAGEDAAMSGLSVSMTFSKGTLASDVTKILLIAIPFILAVLLLTTDSWIEPFLLMFTIGIAIIINMGTNIIFGEISFITQGVAAILQLAIALDYGIFVLYRFSEIRKEGLSVHDSMKKALVNSFSSVTACGIATMIGFAALILMRIEIGPDLGIVLTKGIIISLICVFTLLPALTLGCSRLVEKTHHRSFIPDLKKLAKVIVKASLPALLIFALIVIPFVIAIDNNDYVYFDLFSDERTEIGQDSLAITDTFGGASSLVLMVQKGDLAEEQAVVDEIEAIPNVVSVISYVDTVGAEIPQEYIPESTLSELESANYSRMIITVDTSLEDPESFAAIETIREIGETHYPGEWYLAGEIANAYDMKYFIEEDNIKIEAVGIIAIFIVIMIAFRSVSLPLILVIVIKSAIWINCGLPYFQGEQMFYISYLVISSLQLGITVDYAIMFTSRYVEFRKTLPKRQSLEKTVSTAAISILVSACILLIAGIALWVFSSNALLSEVGMLVGRGSLLSIIAVLFVLPALLMIFDKIIQKTSLNMKFVSDTKGV